MTEEENEEEFVENLKEDAASVGEEQESVTKDLDETGLSDSEEELEQFDPMPYAFILKDVHRNQLVISPEKLHNAKISCPNFHILLDHVVAVLWCFYSQVGHHKLGTSQLHWAIKFLEGLRDWQNRYTPDVSMAIEDLEEALVEIASTVNEEQIINRTYDDQEKPKSPWEFTTQIGQKIESYEAFEASLLKQGTFEGRIEEDDENEEYSFMKNMRKVEFNATRIESGRSLRVESPSIVLNDMFGDEQDALVELLDTSMKEMDEETKALVTSKKSTLIRDSATSFTQNYVTLRNELIDRTIQQLQQIKNIDETFSSIKCEANTEQLSMLKDMMRTS